MTQKSRFRLHFIIKDQLSWINFPNPAKHIRSIDPGDVSYFQWIGLSGTTNKHESSTKDKIEIPETYNTQHPAKLRPKGSIDFTKFDYYY